MIATTELIRWLRTLPKDSSVGIDDGGLTLRCPEEPEVYHEIGGLPEEDTDVPDPQATGWRRWFGASQMLCTDDLPDHWEDVTRPDSPNPTFTPNVDSPHPVLLSVGHLDVQLRDPINGPRFRVMCGDVGEILATEDLRDAVAAALEHWRGQIRASADFIVEVQGGVADVTKIPKGMTYEIIDFDGDEG